jgi:hypothetical protein
MKDFRDRSKDRLDVEASKLFHDLMVSCLDRAEKILRPDTRSQTWNQFRFGILNLGNDKIRQFKDTLVDYSIEFRPTIFSVEYNMGVPPENIVEISFDASDAKAVFFKLKTNIKSVADTLKGNLGCGNVIPVDNGTKWNFVVEDMFNIFHKLIPYFDNNNSFKGQTLERYKEWKEKVYLLEKGNA